ncbi:hypothetical protein PO909_017270 [Leuciscus waleckii]
MSFWGADRWGSEPEVTLLLVVRGCAHLQFCTSLVDADGISVDNLWRFSTAWYGSVRLGTVRLGAERFGSLRFSTVCGAMETDAFVELYGQQRDSMFHPLSYLTKVLGLAALGLAGVTIAFFAQK